MEWLLLSPVPPRSSTHNSLSQTCRNRPIVLTAHSLGGLVIAKAVAYADTGRELYPVMFEAIFAVIFFENPLKDATIASIAVVFSPLAEKCQTFGAVAFKLLEDITLRNSYLKAARKEFCHLGYQDFSQDPRLLLVQRATDQPRRNGTPAQICQFRFPSRIKDLVTEESATVDSYDRLGLTRNHRNLVKFNGPKDEIWSQAGCGKKESKLASNNAYHTAKNRVSRLGLYST